MISAQRISSWLLTVACCSSATVVVGSQDWLQFAGPTRDFKVPVTGLAASWPESGPPRLWSRDLGEGYSSIAAEGNRLYTMYRKGDQELVIALEAATGKTVWEYAYDAPQVAGGGDAEADEVNVEIEPGPHATPLIVAGRIFTMGATGRLHCLSKDSGTVIWSHDLHREFPARLKKRGYAASPLAYKNMVILPVGTPGGSIVAFNQEDGAVVWKQHDFRLAYASLSLINVDGQTQLVGFVVDWIVGLDPDTGDLFWRHPAKSSNGTHVSMPVWGEGNLLFFSAAYGLGGRVVKLTRSGGTTTVQELWHNPGVRLHYSNAIRLGNVIYASTGDFGPAFFTAVDVRTGQIVWRERGIARTSFIYADGRFIILDEEGQLVLATPSEEGLTIHSQAQVLQTNARTVPTLAGKTLYIRDRKTMMALDLR